MTATGRTREELYVRSWREKDVALRDAEQRAEDAVDAAYRQKYGRYPQYVEPIVSPQARATTLRLIPRGGDEEAA